MIDADLTYDLRDLPRFVAELDGGAELVVGDRMESLRPGAMPRLHRYVGNPLLTGVLNRFFGASVRDEHCAGTCCRAWTSVRAAWSSPPR